MSPTVALLVGSEPQQDRYSLHRGYVDAFWAVGATPVVLAPPPEDALERYVAAALACDAICVTGGGDVDPRHYGGSVTGGLMDINPARDHALSLIHISEPTRQAE